MYTSETKIRVRYSETDQMGFVYYGNYPAYFEVGRAEAMRQLGMTYLEMEKDGVVMPIVSMEIKYHRPAFYDDLLTVRTIVKQPPTSRMEFFYEVYNENDKLLTSGQTVLAFVNRDTKRPCQPPAWFLSKIKQFIDQSQADQLIGSND